MRRILVLVFLLAPPNALEPPLHPLLERARAANAWLAMGNAYRATRESQSPLESYERAKAMAPDSDVFQYAFAAVKNAR